MNPVYHRGKRKHRLAAIGDIGTPGRQLYPILIGWQAMIPRATGLDRLQKSPQKNLIAHIIAAGVT
jgi:hypothetical protein